MAYTHHRVSDNAIGAGYPSRKGWHAIQNPRGQTVADAAPSVAKKITQFLNSHQSIKKSDKTSQNE